jgi:hypothetical protein
MDRTCLLASAAVLLLASAATAATAAGPDNAADRSCVVTLLGGERLTGTVAQLDSARRLHLKGEAFQGEAVVPVEKIASLCFGDVPDAANLGEVILAGGGRLRGTVTAVTADTVALDCAAGRLQIPRRAVRAVNLVAVAEVLVGSDFSTGKFDPWKGRAGTSTWAFSDGKANFKIACAVGPVITSTVTTDEAFTVEAKVLPVPTGRRIGLEIRDSGGTTLGLISFSASGASFTLTSSGISDGRNASGQLDPKRLDAKGVILRLINDPRKGMATFWLDDIQLGECKARPPASGPKTVGVDLGGLAAIEYARVLKGVVAPGQLTVAEGIPADGAHIDFANGDCTRAASVALADGRLTFDAGSGQAACKAAVVTRIVFAASPQVEPAAAPVPVQDLVEGDFGRLSLRLVRMTRDEIIGRSDELGEIRLRSAGLRQVTFAPPRTE